MPSANRAWDRGPRARARRSLRRILILCEDTKSSRDYLNRFPRDPAKVTIDCHGTGMNTDSLMEEAIKRRAQAIKEGAPYEAIWVVFDRDNFPLGNFNRAFDLAQNYPDVRACWSNECFELWYLLHFALRDTAVGRQEIWRLISGHLKKKYDKADAEVFKALEPRLDDALKFADILAFKNAEIGQLRRNPSTHVHELVKVLREFGSAELNPSPET